MIFLAVGVTINFLASNLRQKREEAAREAALRKQHEIELIKYRDHLEDIVKQRTTELEKANSELNTYRHRLEEAVAERTTRFAQSNERMTQSIVEHEQVGTESGYSG